MAASSRSRVIVVIGVILVLVLAFFGARFMNVPQAQSRAVNAWSEVALQFQLRAYLTQDVIDAVKVVNPAQLDLIGALENKRQQVINLPADPHAPFSVDRFRAFMATQDALSVELGKVLDLMQLYPERRAQPPVSTVLARLVQSESRIVVARSDYSRAAEAYNRLVTKAPTRWFADMVEPAARPMITSFDLSTLPGA
ncbi:MAG: LemA family protein [Pseudochelatococcus sp.]|jgi:LemA protein|uniref:LemA family protein n=1 Tax=Pseudochelatococcus sp. TaxID=2020869 RepID=UPI003D94573D